LNFLNHAANLLYATEKGNSTGTSGTEEERMNSDKGRGQLAGGKFFRERTNQTGKNPGRRVLKTRSITRARSNSELRQRVLDGDYFH